MSDLLPDSVMRSLAKIQASWTPEDKEFVVREISRLVAIVNFRISQRRVAAEINPEVLGDGSDAVISKTAIDAFRPPK